MLENLQRGDQLAAGELRAAAFVGQGRQRTDDVPVAHVGAEVAFHSPDRHHRFGVDRVAGVDLVQSGRVLCQLALAVAHPQRRNRALQVLPHRADEFGLAAVGFDHCRVGGNPAECLVKSTGADTAGQRVLAEAIAPGLEAFSGLCRDRRCRCLRSRFRERDGGRLLSFRGGVSGGVGAGGQDSDGDQRQGRHDSTATNHFIRESVPHCTPRKTFSGRGSP
ncbi:hypothetical protein FQZ97_650800 [compost metagenome]